MGKRIGAMRVDAELDHGHVGRERLQKGRHHRLEGGEVHGVVGEGLQWQVHRVAHARALAHLVHEARAGEESIPALVGGDGEHVRVTVERELHAVAVMRVDVHVGDLQTALAQRQDGQHRVVDVAEAGGAVRHRVVKPAREVEGAIRLAVRHQARGEQGAAGHELGGLPEAGEDGIVAGAQAIARGMRHPVARAHRAQDVNVLARVEARDGLHVGELGRQHLGARQRGEPVGFHQGPREAEALHAQRVLGAIVEAPPLFRVDEGGSHREAPSRARFQCPLLPPDFSTSRRSVMVTPRSTALTMS